MDRARQGVLDAKSALIDSTLALRTVRLDWERAEALLKEAEASVQAASIAREKAFEQGTGNSRAMVAAAARWRRAFRSLEMQANRLSQAETRMHDGEAALKRAEDTLSRIPCCQAPVSQSESSTRAGTLARESVVCYGP